MKTTRKSPRTKSQMPPPAGGTRPAGTPVQDTANTEGQPPNTRRSIPNTGRNLCVSIEGAIRTRHSLGYCNREYSYAFLRSGCVELSLTPTEPVDIAMVEEEGLARLAELEFANLSRPADATIFQMFPPPWGRLSKGRNIVIQPWEFGYLPKHWPPEIEANVDEIWCYSRYVRDVYLNSGVPANKLQIVPLGVDTNIFNPEAPPYVFTTEQGVTRARKQLNNDPFIFLFVGGSLHRKGIDILIDAMCMAFTAMDNVICVVKDFCTGSVYRIGNSRDRLLQFANDTSRPCFIYMDNNLSPHQLAGLYARAHCLVMPYRGEGFCLPCLEALACGCPVMATAGGPTDDFLDESCGWPLASVRKEVEGNRIGEWECVQHPWMFEVSTADLALRMREVVNNREEAKRRGMAGVQRVQAGWTWDHAGARALECIDALLAKPEAFVSRKSEKAQIHLSHGDAETRRNVDSQGRICVNPRNNPDVAARIAAANISFCMIVKNEERVLGTCLRSLLPVANEIRVVDTGSTDTTVQIAESYGATVLYFEWCDNFATARNASIEGAVGAWICWVDADDCLPDSTAEAILRAVETAPDNIVGFVIPVQFVESSGAASGTRVDHVKLFRNIPGLKFTGRIHEQILGSLRATGMDIARCPNAIVLHSGYDTSPEGQRRKRERDDRILALELADNPNDPFANFNRGMTSHYAADHVDAVKRLRRSLELAHPSDSIVRKAYALLAVSHRELGQSAEYEAALDEGLSIYPADPELNFHLGQLRTSQKRFNDAKVHYLRCLSANIDDHFSSIDMGIVGPNAYKTHHNLGGVCLMAGDYPGARQWWLKAIESSPQFDASRLSLFNAALEAKDHETADAMLMAFRKALPEGVELWWLTSRYAQAVDDGETAERCLRKILEADPAAGPPKLALAKELLHTNRLVEAEPLLTTLSDSGVAEAAYYLGVTRVRNGDLPSALNWMERALSLNPGHAETMAQVDNLKRAVAAGGGS